jgi:NTE family protein
VDGGLADHGEVLGSIAEAVDEIYLLPAGSACALPTAPSSAFGVAVHALTPLIQQRLVSAVSHARPI